MSSRAKQWKRPVFEDVEFPSGKTANLVRPSMMNVMTREGNIPNSLQQFIFSGGHKTMDDNDPETMRALMFLADRLAIAAFSSPRVVTGREPNYDADEMALDDIDDTDKLFLLNWVMQGGEPAEALARFLEQQRTGLAAS